MKKIFTLIIAVAMILAITVTPALADTRTATKTTAILGDIDGDGRVGIVDALLAIRHAMGLAPLTATQEANGDVTGDGVVTVADAVAIYRTAILGNVNTKKSESITIGDVNGDGRITRADADLALRGAMGVVRLSVEQVLRADMDGNSILNVSDALLILRASEDL